MLKINELRQKFSRECSDICELYRFVFVFFKINIL